MGHPLLPAFAAEAGNPGWEPGLMLQRGAFLIEGCRAALGVTSLQPGWLPGVMGVGIPWNKYGVGDGPCRGDAVFSCYIPFSHPHVITDGHGMSAASREVPAPWLCCTVLPSRASLRPSAARSGAKALSWQCLTLVLNMEHPGKHQGSQGESAHPHPCLRPHS